MQPSNAVSVAEQLVFVLTTTAGKFVLINLLMVMPLAALLTWMERRQSAYMQDRLGPTRAHFLTIRGKPVTLFGLVHVIADATKMLFKETFVPKGADATLFWLAPAIGFVSSLVIMTFVPFAPAWQTSFAAPWDVIEGQMARLDAGLMWVFGMASLGIYGTALAGWSSNNKFAMLGGLRASAQIISYEIALGLTLVGMLLVTGTTELSAMLNVQQGPALWGFVPRWGLFLQPVGAVLFFVAAMAETKRAPFDMPEGESEIIGYFLEYSSMGFGLFMLGEFVEVVVLAAMFTTLFLGGWSLPWVGPQDGVALGPVALMPGQLGYSVFFLGVFAIKVFLVCALQLQVRWSLPRFRYDQLMHLGWKILLPLALVNIVASAGLLAWDPSLVTMMQVGVGLWAALFLYTLAGPTRAPVVRLAHKGAI